jgi:hypothetical protein
MPSYAGIAPSWLINHAGKLLGRRNDQPSNYVKRTIANKSTTLHFKSKAASLKEKSVSSIRIAGLEPKLDA